MIYVNICEGRAGLDGGRALIVMMITIAKIKVIITLKCYSLNTYYV